jgi:FMN phosphatase YigB (HAD superfamily)
MRQFFFSSVEIRPIARTIPSRGDGLDQPPGAPHRRGQRGASRVDTIESGPVFCYCHAVVVASAAPPCFRLLATLPQRGAYALIGGVLFDFGGTLDADGIPWKTRFFRLCREEGLVTDPERFDPVFYAVDDALVGAIPATLPFRDTVDLLAAGMTRAFGGDDTVRGRIASRFVDEAIERVRGNRSLLSRLGRRYRLGIVSNFYGNLVTVCHNVKIRAFFSVIVDSQRVGCSKPDPRIFQSALDELGLTAADVVFVGDSLPRDMAGARAIGMRHVWLVGEATAPAAPCCPDDRVLHSLGELEGLLT